MHASTPHSMIDLFRDLPKDISGIMLYNVAAMLVVFGGILKEQTI